MNRTEIVEAALRVWGDDHYRTTSLTQLAGELKVTKPALYRHFASKEALLKAMEAYFFNRYEEYIKPYIEKALNTRNMARGYRLIVRALTEFFIKNKYLFIFALIQVYGSKKPGERDEEMKKRGIDFARLRVLEGKKHRYPSYIQMVGSSVVFFAGYFHRFNCLPDRSSPEQNMKAFIAGIEKKIARGLDLKRVKINAMDFEKLEAMLPRTMLEEDNRILKAVAGAVAEAGPWNASMDMIARRSGLSKSSLYSHFKNKQDMLSRLFFTEIEYVINYVRESINKVSQPEDQLYLALLAIADYLRSRPEMLITMNWLRIRRIKIDLHIPPDFFSLFSEIPLGLKDEKTLTPNWKTHWIVFLIVNILMQAPAKNPAAAGRKAFSALPDTVFRTLFRFIGLGVEGGGA
jgi:AcrR family transcriptional regulator